MSSTWSMLLHSTQNENKQSSFAQFVLPESFIIWFDCQLSGSNSSATENIIRLHLVHLWQQDLKVAVKL